MVSCYIMGPVIFIQDELGIGKKKTTVLMLCVCGIKLPRKILHPECKRYFILPAWDKNEDRVLL